MMCLDDLASVFVEERCRLSVMIQTWDILVEELKHWKIQSGMDSWFEYLVVWNYGQCVEVLNSKACATYSNRSEVEWEISKISLYVLMSYVFVSYTTFFIC